MANNRNSIVAGVIVLAAAVGFLAWKGILGYPPQGTEGTIGAAKRYQSEQIAAGDVELNDPQTQAFIQSDLFHRLQTDVEFRKGVIAGGLDRFITAEAHAVDMARSANELARAAEAAKLTDAAAKAKDLAARAEELARLRSAAARAAVDAGKAAEVARAALDLAKRKGISKIGFVTAPGE